VKMDVTGIKETIGFFGRMDAQTRKGMRNGVQKWLEMVASESQNQVPWLTGQLAQSMEVKMHARSAAGDISYNTKYAWAVHEVPRPAGSTGKWKYLEDPLKQLEPHLEAIIAEEVEKALP